MSVKAYTRPIQPSDISDLADLAADVFGEDELFAVMWPLRQRYYHSFRRSWLRQIKTMLGRQGAYGFIIRSLDTDEVIGAAIWRRLGPETSPIVRGWRERNSGFGSILDRQLRGWEDWYVDTLRLESCAMNRPRFDRWQKGCNALREKWEESLPDRWHLHLIMVAGKYQGKGYGGKLLQWGKEHARDERVPITLFASEKGQRLYGKHGFEVVDRVFVNDIETGAPLTFGPMMVCNPGYSNGTR